MEKQALEKILIFVPEYKHVIWGGTRISMFKGESIDSDNIGESWEISAIQNHETVVAEGIHKGLTLDTLIAQYGIELLGARSINKYGLAFPLLVKFIDANQTLSLQVHPDDRMAKEMHNSLGKTELWYTIDATKDAKIYCGLKEALTPESYSRHIIDKTIMDVVKQYDAEPGQFYFLPSGTIHSIGAGNLIAEIQESSDITYRVYDHDRRDTDGNLRQLHTEEARQAIDYTFPNDSVPSAIKFDSSRPEAISCQHFTVGYFNLTGNTETIPCDHQSFNVIMVVQGEITIQAENAQHILTAGHTALIPAYVTSLSISGNGCALTATV